MTTSLLKNTAQPQKRDMFIKYDNEGRDVLGDSRKRYRYPWVEIEKYGPRWEPIWDCRIRYRTLWEKNNASYWTVSENIFCSLILWPKSEGNGVRIENNDALQNERSITQRPPPTGAMGK